MAKKEKAPTKKGVTVGKKNDGAAGDSSGKGKKPAKERPKRAGKGSWHGDGVDLAAELASVGLRIKDITGDGNCFFRALGDQLEGDERQHVQLRQRVVSYISEHEEDFAPFVEDDEAFGSYVARMKKDGVWAGYMEVVAASRCLGANLTIYQAGQPRWRVLHHPEDSAPMLHLSYHDGQHYNSVRAAGDFGTGPPAPVMLRGDGTMPARPARGEGDGAWDERDERRVAESTACTDMGLVRRALEAARGDVDAAIERVIEVLAAAPEAQVEAGPVAAAAAAEQTPAATQAEAARVTPAEADASVKANGSGALLAGQHVGDAGREPRAAGLDGVQGAAGVNPGAGAAARKSEAAVPQAAESDGSSGRQACEDGSNAAEQAVGGSVAITGTAVQGSNGIAEAASSGTGEKAGAASRKAEGRKGPGAAFAPSNNKRCPCGSNKKYKACCGPAAAAAQRRRAAAGDSGETVTADAAASATVVAAQVAALVI